jgi:hypothetical protein
MFIFFLVFLQFGNCQSGDHFFDADFFEIITKFDDLKPDQTNENRTVYNGQDIYDIENSLDNPRILIAEFENKTSKMNQPLLEETCDYFPGSCEYLNNAIDVLFFQSVVHQSLDNSSTHHTTIIKIISIFLSVQFILVGIFVGYELFRNKRKRRNHNFSSTYHPVQLSDSVQ